jgi:cell division protein ZapA
MAQISVRINGRQYRMACSDGQEEHLMQLAADVDQRIQAMRGQFGEVGDTRLTIMGAITLADELADANKRVGDLEQELASLRAARQTAIERTRAAETAFIDVIASTAERIENAARSLARPQAAHA